MEEQPRWNGHDDRMLKNYMGDSFVYWYDLFMQSLHIYNFGNVSMKINLLHIIQAKLSYPHNYGHMLTQGFVIMPNKTTLSTIFNL